MANVGDEVRVLRGLGKGQACVVWFKGETEVGITIWTRGHARVLRLPWSHVAAV